ncbi:O-antigen ligase family protein [uncultured Butyricimonas sp.]|uniref:O-antigen ligase family protein n=1 Tax=uncultured Butyricimonas sp. TaxID=1268785 RepID=UPI0026DCC294|nr:O-antigen ligase family protein [uncultured Butyricimonas sp.]
MNIHKITIGIAIVLLPVLYRLDHCFTGLSAAFFSLVLFSLALIPYLLSRESYSWRKNDTLVGLLLCWTLIRYFTSPVLDDTFILFDWLAAVIAYTWARNSSAADTIFPALFVGGIVQSAWGILQFSGNIPSYHAYFGQTGSFNTPALWGIYLAMAIFGGIRLLGTQTRKGYKMLVLAGMAFVSAGMILAHSRAAWVALACGLAWTFLKPAKKPTGKKWNKKAVLTTVALLLLAALALWGVYLIRPDSAKGRLLVYGVSLFMLGDAPWFGHGIASFAAEYMPYQAEWFLHHPASSFARVAGNNHFAFNECLKIACEQGIIGLALFCLLVFCSIRHVNGATRYHAGLVVIIFIFGMFGYPFEDTSITCVFYVAAASIAGHTQVVGRVTSVPRWVRYSVGTVLLACLLVTGAEYRYRKIVETDLQEAGQERESILPPCFAEYYRALYASPDFVLRYAEELYTRELYREALPVLKQARRLQCNELILISLGECYRHEGEHDKAIEAFSLASRMTPAYILPCFHLFSLYRETGEEEKARQVAAEALSMQVKIVNTTVLRAKHTMRTYLNETEKGGEK